MTPDQHWTEGDDERRVRRLTSRFGFAPKGGWAKVKRTPLALPMTPETLAVDLTCTDRGAHPERSLWLVSWAPDGRGYMVHSPHLHRTVPFATAAWQALNIRDRLSLDGIVIGLTRRCPKCNYPWAVPMEEVERIVQQVAAAAPGEIRSSDLSLR